MKMKKEKSLMNKPLLIASAVFTSLLLILQTVAMSQTGDKEFDRDYIVTIMHKVNDYQQEHVGWLPDRNWKRATYYTGVMAFYKATGDSNLLNQAINWAKKHDWQVGNEWLYPANRLTCVQTYLEIFFIRHDSTMIISARKYMDSRLSLTEPAYMRGWFYIDALYVGPPAFVMMSRATGDDKYIAYMNRVFWEVADQLYDKEEGLFYRDSEALFKEKSKNGKKVLWSRGNGWVIASLPRIVTYLTNDDPYYIKYEDLLRTMAASLAKRQGEDCLWRANLGDKDDYPMPESSGTGFFTYAIAWGINNGMLDQKVYSPVVSKAWKGLCNIVDEQGKVCWGQLVGREPEEVKQEHSHEYVTGAFLLAGSEVLKLIQQSD